MDYTDLATMKATLELTTAQTFADNDISLAISAASQWIDEACGRSFGKDTNATNERKFLPVNGGYAVIDDLCTFTSLTDVTGSTWTLDTDFFLEPINAAAQGWPYTAIRTIARPFIFPLSAMQQGWAGFDGRITVTGQWGWSAVPQPIVEAATILAGRLLGRARAPLGVVNVGLDGAAVRISRLDPDVMALIGPYQRAFIV